MQYRAIIPVKALQQAKSRLADHLSLEQREQLVLTMLRHVLIVLHENTIDTTVVSPDARVLSFAHSMGARVFEEEQAGHNRALQAAALRLLNREMIVARNDIALLTLSADLPLIQVDEIQALLEESRTHDVVLAASQEGTGTNALLVHPPLTLPYLFGPDSLQRYLAESAQRHLRTKVHKSHGLSFDIDTIDDLELLQMYAWEYKTMQCCLDEAYSLASLS